MFRRGEVVGQYELVRRLGAGAFGEVWLARHLDLRVERALKIPTDPDYVRQLRHEAQIQCAVDHPNVVETHELYLRHDPPHFVMDYVEGQDLRRRLEEHGPPSPQEALWVLSQVLEALAAAHARGVLHRDLKPENVLVTPGGRVKVADFGLGRVQADVARSLVLSGSLQTSGGRSVSGTLEYMSPEQKAGAAPDPRDDLYAVGVIGCELLTGSRPLGVGVARMFERAGLDERLAAIVGKALDEAEHRYGSAAAMLADVRPLLDAERPRETPARRAPRPGDPVREEAARFLKQVLAPLDRQLTRIGQATGAGVVAALTLSVVLANAAVIGTGWAAPASIVVFAVSLGVGLVVVLLLRSAVRGARVGRVVAALDHRFPAGHPARAVVLDVLGRMRQAEDACDALLERLGPRGETRRARQG